MTSLILVRLTPEQQAALSPLFDQIKAHNAAHPDARGPAIVAQVWADGLVAKVLQPGDAIDLAHALRASGGDCYSAAQFYAKHTGGTL